MAGYIGSKASVVSSGAERKKTFDITTSTSSLTGLSYTVGQVHVFHNGVRLVDGTDYTATNGTSITLTAAAESGDQVVVVSYATFQTSDTVSASAGGTFAGDVTFDGSFTSQGIDDNATSTAMTLDASGNLLVGKTSTSSASAGVVLQSSGLTLITRDDATPASIRRNTSDGDLLAFTKDGAAVGSIGTAGDLLYVSSASGAGFRLVNDDLRPSTGSTNADASYDLGHNNVRWRDLYLSGGVYLGGTGSANKLDDYEEGTWTPTSGNSGTLTFTRAYYTKIGRQVTLQLENIILSDTTSSTSIAITGLPFTTGVVSATGSMMSSHRDNKDAVTAFISQGVDEIRFYLNSGTVSYQRMVHSMFSNSSGSIYATITYFTT